MKLSINGINLIKKFEGCSLTAYNDVVGVATIGYGNTFYTDGNKVKIGDKITQAQADELFLLIAKDFVDDINLLVKSTINQNQFDSLTSLSYNIGISAFNKSTVLKKVNLNPLDPTIGDSFKLWNKANGKVLEGLTTRRIAEGNLYFKK